MAVRRVAALSPGRKARLTARWARIMTKGLIAYSRRTGARWRFAEFGGMTGAEPHGIVDIVAIRKDDRPRREGIYRGDLFEIVLIQAKAGGARFPATSDVDRLIAAKNYHRAKAVVLAEWKLGMKLKLYRLVGRRWHPASVAEIFG